ncbi:histidine phosphatase family protein [Thiosocius teredinicola]|uniref:histidine phosphatase family protein n=1 Tax=Thiosocius teredinicola TaxID=1973002 RepID=UPI0009912083
MGRLFVALIRHGDYRQLPGTPSAHQPFPLTDSGRAQAAQAVEMLRETLRNEAWKLEPLIECSNLLRAWQTAQIIADGLQDAAAGGVRLRGTDALAERGLGSAANLTLQQIEAAVAEDPRFSPLPSDWKSNSRYRLPLMGAESLLEAGERVAAYIRQCMADMAVHDTPEDRLKLFVGHGAAFRHAAYHLGVLEYADIARLSMYHVHPVYLECIGDDWRHVGGEWKVRHGSGSSLD